MRCTCTQRCTILCGACSGLPQFEKTKVLSEFAERNAFIIHEIVLLLPLTIQGFTQGNPHDYTKLLPLKVYQVYTRMCMYVYTSKILLVTKLLLQVGERMTPQLTNLCLVVAIAILLCLLLKCKVKYICI